jgi:hypothetical protein
MEHPLIHDRGRGPELVGTRTTIYNLVPYFLKPIWTEAAIADANNVSVEQVAVMRCYFLAHHAEVMEQHQKIEERIHKGMQEQAKPEFRARFWWNRERLEEFREWLKFQPTESREDFKARCDEFREWCESSEAVGASG